MFVSTLLRALVLQASSLIDMYPKVRVVVDLFELTSMKFMNQRFFDWSLPPTLWPPYASGSVFSSAMFDTMLCQVSQASACTVPFVWLVQFLAPDVWQGDSVHFSVRYPCSRSACVVHE